MGLLARLLEGIFARGDRRLADVIENAWKNGYDGVCAWKTPQNDGAGSFEEIVVATNEFYAHHPALVYPN